MRTTIDIPDELLRKTITAAALRGSTMKELIVDAVLKEVGSWPHQTGKRIEVPLLRLPKGKKLKLGGFDFDDLLA